MISNETILKIQERLAKGLFSYRNIAGQCGVSLGTVASVAAGNRTTTRIYRRPSRKRRQAKQIQTQYQRCPLCGHNVVWPCLACSLEAMKDFDDVPEGLILGLELRSMHCKRYEEIRRQKERPAAYDVITPGKGIK